MRKTLNIAHRGGAGLMPENTMAAFGDAMARGADGAELDVQLSADGVVVVHHDYRLNPGYCRAPDGNWLTDAGPRIKDLTLAELKTFDLGRPRPDSDYARAHPDLTAIDGARVPALAEVVAAARTKDFILFVELKSDTSPDSADPLALADATLAVCGDYLGRIVFVGFDWRGLVRLRPRAPQAECWFTTDRLTGDYRPVLDGIQGAGAAGWFPHFADATGPAIADAHARGLKIGAWTVNEIADMQRLAGQGLDALCTDRPDRMRNLLSA
jgi:glycerophosphoryl diester phosphodiesterase